MDLTGDIVALFGVQREDYTYSPRHYNGLRLCGYKGHSRQSAEYAVSLIGRGNSISRRLISHNLPLEAYNHGIELLRKDARRPRSVSGLALGSMTARHSCSLP
jgi:hypothetical protein